MLQPREIKIDESLTYQEQPVQLLDQKVKILRNKQIPQVKVLWKHQGLEEATWKLEENMRREYPKLFSVKSTNFGDEILLKGEGYESSRIKNECLDV